MKTQLDEILAAHRKQHADKQPQATLPRGSQPDSARRVQRRALASQTFETTIYEPVANTQLQNFGEVVELGLRPVTDFKDQYELDHDFLRRKFATKPAEFFFVDSQNRLVRITRTN